MTHRLLLTFGCLLAAALAPAAAHAQSGGLPVTAPPKVRAGGKLVVTMIAPQVGTTECGMRVTRRGRFTQQIVRQPKLTTLRWSFRVPRNAAAGARNVKFYCDVEDAHGNRTRVQTTRKITVRSGRRGRTSKLFSGRPKIMQTGSPITEDTVDLNDPTIWTGRPIPATFVEGGCEWYAVQRRPDIFWRWNASEDVPYDAPWQAAEWDDRAREIGYRVDSTPAPDAIAVWNPYVGYTDGGGHVAAVDVVHADGSLTITDSNVDGVRSPRPRLLPASLAAQLVYIHPLGG